jgi:hypothetical protein
VLPSPFDAKHSLSKAGIEAAWHKIRTAAGLDDVRLHDPAPHVRTYAGQSGANPFLVRDLLRHKNLAMTGRYVNRADDPVRTLSDQAGERIAAGLAGGKGGDVVTERGAAEVIGQVHRGSNARMNPQGSKPTAAATSKNSSTSSRRSPSSYLAT